MRSPSSNVGGSEPCCELPSRGEPKRVRMARHIAQRREPCVIDERVAVVVVVPVPFGAIVAAELPVVVQPDVAVPKVAQRGWHAVDCVARVTPHHGVHDAFDELLIDVSTVEVPCVGDTRSCDSG